jgi:hypothetical protein
MILRLHTFLVGCLALLLAALLALAPVGAKPASGGYQLLGAAASGHQADSPLAALGNFDYFAKIAPECCNAPNRTLTQIDTPIDLTNGRSGHILANHRAGAGKAGKTEFPSNWDDQRIIHQVSDISTDQTLIRQVDSRGTPYVSGTRDGLDITVTFFPDSHPRAGQISSAYPTNVPANPRP